MEIYLDNAASTKMHENVIKKIAKASKEYYANPYSIHALGLKSRKALEDSRKELAKEIGARAEEVIFTSGGTESNALAIIGAAREKKKNGKNKIMISCLEHSSVYENAKALEKEGFIVKEVPANEEEGLDLKFLFEELDDKTALVSISSIISEVGIINDISRIAKECKRKNVLLHVDNTQGFGKINMQVKNIGIDLLTADAHKIGGPKGIGFLYVRNGVNVAPLFFGAEKERILRPGTGNVIGAIGFVAALKEYKKINWESIEKNKAILEKGIEKIGGRITAKNIQRAKGHLHVCFKNKEGEEIVSYLSTKKIYCSTGSACNFTNKEKRILFALGIPEDYRRGALRFTFAEEISEKNIRKVLTELKNSLSKPNTNF